MKRVRIVGLVVATIMTLFMFVPVELNPIVDGAPLVGIQDACAQTGTCKWSPNDICFVNGVGYPNREWQGAEVD